MPQSERVMLRRGPVSPSEVGKDTSRNPKRVVRRSLSGVATLLDLQRSHGNAFVQRLVQRKLAVSQPGDKYEQEADRVADAVVQKSNTSSVIPSITRYAERGVHRKCTECEEEMQRQPEKEEEEKLQRQVGPGVEEVKLQAKAGAGGARLTGDATEGAIRALQGGGQPLPESVRAYIEPRMGYDFTGVQIHTDGHAAQLARSVDALAFTVGRDIVFGAGQYRPETNEGKRLLAHELTHVVQQNQGSANMISRACLPAADCPAIIPGSAEDFGAAEEVRELGPRDRRKRMTCSRALSTTHAGRARQLENILGAHDPSLLAQIHGIFIDADLSPGTGAMVTDCGGWETFAMPASCHPPALSGAAKPCVFVHARLNQEGFAFNHSAAATIGGQPREDWRISTLQTLIHEAQHVVFDTSARPEPAGAAACPRASVAAEITELNAIMSEFPIVFRAIPAAPGPARNRAINRLDNWFNFKITNPSESLSGTLKAMRCQCDCAEVNAHIQDVFDLVTASWSVAEKDAFNIELRKAKWNVAPIDLKWPL
jgi:Domain of unknown function (DUF4157)